MSLCTNCKHLIKISNTATQPELDNYAHIKCLKGYFSKLQATKAPNITSCEDHQRVKA